MLELGLLNVEVIGLSTISLKLLLQDDGNDSQRLEDKTLKRCDHIVYMSSYSFVGAQDRVRLTPHWWSFQQESAKHYSSINFCHCTKCTCAQFIIDMALQDLQRS